MSSEIQFGELQQSEPEKDIRPDRDAHFCVIPCDNAAMPGQAGFRENELMIFVDLDVMRDMEAHASSDISVELGGVMLGCQRVDETGQPFVVVTDSLRAEHYHASKGNFKFTHDTWSRITEQREQYRPDLEMVGWYHTHPGHTVFLSGLDMFICNNFFDKPLDLALVIDPVNDDRGWFQWVGGRNKQTRRTAGFYLTASRHRQDELKYFSSLYTRGKPMNIDPRYSSGSISGSSQPVVNIMESGRKPIIDLAIIAMLTFQFLLIGALLWKVLQPGTPEMSLGESAVASSRLHEQEEIISSIVSRQTGDEDLVKKYLDLKEENHRLTANLDGQIARADLISGESDVKAKMLAVEVEKSNKLVTKFNELGEKNTELSNQVDALTELAKEKGIDPELAGRINYWQYLWWVLAATIGAVAGFLFGRKRGLLEADEYFGDDPKDDRPRIKDTDSNVDFEPDDSNNEFGEPVSDEPGKGRAGGERMELGPDQAGDDARSRPSRGRRM